MVNWLKNQLIEFLCWIWDREGNARARRHARRFVRQVMTRREIQRKNWSR